MADLLKRLQGAKGPLSGAALARALGISRAAVHKRIEKLRAQGHRIAGVNRLGYRLEGSADVFASGAFAPGWGRPFHHAETATSTQDLAKDAAARGVPEGGLFVADRQTAGRGRLGRRWESAAGGLWCSFILRPPLAPAAATGLALAAAVDWAWAVRAVAGVEARIKWPNDLWVGEKKLAGILTEMSSEADRVHWIVLGAGLNVNNAPPAGAVSLRSLTGRPWRRQDLLEDWLERFRKSSRLYNREGFAPFREAFAGLSVLDGRDVAFETAGGEAVGRALGVDRDGRLVVRTARGEEALAAGEVRLLRPR